MGASTKILGEGLEASPLWSNSVSVPARWLFICLLLKTDDDGEIRVDEDYQVCAQISGLGIQSSQRALAELERAKLATVCGDTIVVNRVKIYRYRQSKTQAKSTERVRQWRLRNASEKETPPTTPPNVVQASTGTEKVSTSSTSSTTSNASAKWAKKPDDVTEDVWLEFVTMRRKKKATVTDRVLNGIRRQGKMAGISLQEALETCLDRGWASVKAEWLNKDNKQTYKGDISEAGEIDF